MEDERVSILKPTAKGRVIDLLAMTGMDVSQWALNSDGTPARTPPSSNPRFCYGWSFGDEKRTVSCLWWEDMRHDDQGVFTSLPLLKMQVELPAGNQRRRTDDLVEALHGAYQHRSDVIVLVVRGADRRPGDGPSDNKVHFREKDPTTWHVTGWDNPKGHVTLRRGGQWIGGRWYSGKELSQLRNGSDPSISEDIAEIEAMQVSETERQELRKARIGQGAFRAALLERWDHRCAVTGIGVTEVLRASHCVPWRKASNDERLSPKNGLLLSANLDALFDAGLISFQDDGTVLLARKLKHNGDWIDPGMRLRKPLDDKEIEFLRRHRAEEFEKHKRAIVMGYET